MSTIDENDIALKNFKKKGTNILGNINESISNALDIFKKDESSMTIEEKIEKQHLFSFIYGMGAGIVVYHFMIGALLILVIIWFYNLSLKRTKILIDEQRVESKSTKRRSNKKRKSTERKSEG